MRQESINRNSPFHIAPLLLLLSACGSGDGGDQVGGPAVTAALAPVVSSFEPVKLDPRESKSITLKGENFKAPVTVRLLGAQDQVLAETTSSIVSADGRRTTFDSPQFSTLYGLELARIHLVNSDGAETTTDATLRFELPQRQLDGSDNHQDDPMMGAAGTALMRLVQPAYNDGISEMSNSYSASPRLISNLIFSQEQSLPDPGNRSAYLWQWGQFLDHDLSLTPSGADAEAISIEVPRGDPWFDPEGSGGVVISMQRSAYMSAEQPRQQLNMITAFIDASNVYGSDQERASALRMLDGSGRLKHSEGEMLPLNTEGMANDGGSDNLELYVAGDVRANEQIGLTAMHTLFMREHNRLALEIATEQPDFSGEEIYQAARRIVGAQLQVITYQDFLPLLLGPDWLTSYAGYDANTDPRIANLFSTACYRFGHSLLSPEIKRLDAAGETWSEGDLSLRQSFFEPGLLQTPGSLEATLRGLASTPSQTLDARLVDDVRNFLFGPPGAGGFDLASLNIQRGRDHGLSSYTATRAALGLSVPGTFAELATDPDTRERIHQAYSSIEEVDVWVGGLAEQPVAGAMVGELIHTVLAAQFTRLRDGDHYWFENLFSGEPLATLRATTLADVIRRNTAIGDELSDDVFHLPTQQP